MFADPLALDLTTDGVNLAVVPSNSNHSIRKGTSTSAALPVQLTLGATPSRENPAAGGSVRHLIRTDIPVLNVDGENIGNASAITILVVPNQGVNVAVRVKEAAQANVSFLLAENNAAAAAEGVLVDATTLTRFLNGEG